MNETNIIFEMKVRILKMKKSNFYALHYIGHRGNFALSTQNSRMLDGPLPNPCKIINYI